VKLATWRILARTFDNSRRLLLASTLFAVLQSAALVPVALVVQNVFDNLIPEHDTSGLVWSGVAVLGLYLLAGLLALCTRFFVLKSTKRSITTLRGQLLERVYSLPRAYFDRNSLGKLQSILVYDSERLDVMSNALVGSLMPAVIVATGLSVVLLVLNALLFVVLLAVVPLLLLVGRLLGSRVRARVRDWRAAFDLFSTKTQLALRAMTLAKVQAAEQAELASRRAEHAEVGRTGLRMSWLQSVYTIVENLVAASSGAVVLVLGGLAVARGSMTVGELLSFYAILALLLRELSTILAAIPQVLAGYESMDRIQKILEADDREPYEGTRQIDFTGELSLEGVNFGYGREEVLRDLNFRVEAGSHVAVFGPNGAGKSTLVSLILGLYRPDAGRVLADGVPFDELDVRHLRRRIGVVLQDPVIFPGTIADNIAYGRPDAEPEEVRRAARWSTADSFIDKLPEGYETEVGDEGGLLSGGQRQRIAIARALIAHPALLILDEPTTHLDDRSIDQLIANLNEFPGAPTLLMISHDPAVARAVESVVYLRDGRMVRESTPVEAV
jgi:ABC-type bacteriocin/lantibiotic exporter with double-glycine peptidase domain